MGVIPEAQHRPSSLGGQCFGVLHDGIRELAEPTGHVGCFGPKSQSFSVASGSTVARPPGSGYFQIPKGWLVNLSHTLLPRESTCT